MTRTEKACPARRENQGVYLSQPSPLHLLVLSKVPFRGKVFHAATRQKFTRFQRWKERKILFSLSFVVVLSRVGLKAVVGWTGFVLFCNLHLLLCKLCFKLY